MSDTPTRIIVKCIARCYNMPGHGESFFPRRSEIDVGEIREFIEYDTDTDMYYHDSHAWYPKERFVPATQLEKLLWIGRGTNEVKVNA